MYPSLYDYINNTNLSKTHPEDYCPPLSTQFQLPSPHYITLDEGTIFNELSQKECDLFSNDHNNHNANNISIHQEFTSHDIRASLQSTMGKCSNNIGEDGFNKPKGSSKRRRASTNDRHSKINTAQGPRDRRMRLSLDVGKKFFMLQDLLGFDKASKTVEWLLMKSKSNIQELIPHGKSGVSISESSTSKCELLSEYIDDDQNTKSSSSINQKGKKKTSRGVRKSSYLLRPLAKESRLMARKRARERTLEKSSKLACAIGANDQFSKIRPCLDKTMEQDMNCLGSWNINQPGQPSSHFHLKQGVHYDDSPSMIIGGWNPSFLFNYQQTGVHPQEHQLHDFQIHGNIWEVRN
ncbi:hypothetical protein L1987_80298 [Smallanthus sonchifolius]|uniref:Uncharacterized protein n=1 Tax=Smallanthus sonchifolius TaxID=185202 RepID=A0ACB8YMV7_9ASTR|nr:hypothetical protein L1987_80298 [Smallanthus sonchifolius]